MARGGPLVSKKVPVVVGRVERFNLRIPDIVGELLQPRKNVGKARCPPGVSVGRHVVLVIDAPQGS
jgi:hypothetical protein